MLNASKLNSKLRRTACTDKSIMRAMRNFLCIMPGIDEERKCLSNREL